MTKRTLFWGIAISICTFAFFKIRAMAQNAPNTNETEIVKVAVAGLAHTEEQAAYMMRAKSEAYIISQNPTFGLNNKLKTADQVMHYLLAGDRQKRFSRWIQNGHKGKSTEIWYDIDKKTGDRYSTVIASGYDGEHSYGYLLPPHRHTGNGWVKNENGMAIGYLIGNAWGGNFSSSSKFSSQLLKGAPKLIDHETVQGMDTLKIVAQTNSNGTPIKYTVWICPSRSYRCIRKEIEVTINGPEYKLRRNIYETLSYERFTLGNDDLWLPKRGVSIDCLVGNSEDIYWRRLEWFNLLEAEPLQSVEQSVFSFQFPLGTTLSLNNTDTSHTASISYDVHNVTEELMKLKPKPDIQEFVKKVISDQIMNK